MGQEDYLNSLLNSVVEIDNKEDEKIESGVNIDFDKVNDSNTSESMGAVIADVEWDSIGDLFADAEEEPVEDIVAVTEEEPMGDVFASVGEEPMGDIVAEEEEEPMGDVFASAGEEPVGDIVAEEEPIGDVFANEEEEPIGDVFASEEEEPIGDVFASEEEEPIGDVFASEEEESIGDVFASEEEEPIGDVFVNAEEEPAENTGAGDTLINSIDSILSGAEALNFDDAPLDETEEPVDESGNISSSVKEEPDNLNAEEDIFSMFSTYEEPKETLDLEDTNDGPIDKKSLFDDDLMKLLGEEDLSSEDIFADNDEDEMLKALENKDKTTSPSANSEKNDAKKDKKSGLFSKLFKKKNDKNADKSTSEENEAILEELSKEEKKKKKDKKSKAKKEKKPKKEKAPKKEKTPKPVVIEEPSAPLHKGQVIGIFVLCISIGVFIILGVNLVPYSFDMNNAKRYYEREQYKLAYSEIEGLSIKEKDMTFYRKLQVIMILSNQLDTYQTYDSLNLKPEALSELLKGVAKYDEHYAEAQQYGVAAKYDSIFEQITNELNTNFGVSVDTARTINALETSKEYSAQIYNITK